MSTMRFENTGNTFSGLNAALRWCRENGYIYGSLQAHAPTGVHRESEVDYISKWRNLVSWEKEGLDGHLIADGGDYRDGDVVLHLNPKAVA